MRINPQTKKRLRRFREIKRGYYSFLLFCFLVLFCYGAELIINSRALIVHYDGNYYFPTYGEFIPGTTFGEDYEHETNYRKLKQRFSKEPNNWLVMPPVPYNPLENDLKDSEFPPYAPSLDEQHYLGTDKVGRDVLARLVYGFRVAFFFSLLLLILSYAIGVLIGCAMGYFGGRFDLFFQRLIEIWTNVPSLYVVIIIASIMVPNFWSLLLFMVFFNWTMMTWYMRTQTYKEKEREYVHAVKSLGASHTRIILKHILPNTISLIVTFAPFTMVSGITALTALDFLGFGIPAPEPSWGELLRQGREDLSAYWIGGSVVVAMVIVLTMVTFIGEAVREAFDPKKFTFYE